jgi:hypothetical protein
MVERRDPPVCRKVGRLCQTSGCADMFGIDIGEFLERMIEQLQSKVA